MKRGRKLMVQDQIQSLCIKCQKRKQTPGPNSKLGYKRYLPLCSKCTKEKYNIYKYSYRKNKKPHCERCGFIGDSCQLDVHHIDRNRKNNTALNLLTLCANCHRLEHKNEFM